MFKNLLAIFAVGLVLITTAADADAARRFGGGSSFGRSAPTLRQATPPQSAPALQGQRQADAGGDNPPGSPEDGIADAGERSH